MEHFPRIRYVAALRQSQKFIVQIGRNTTKFHRTTFPVEQEAMNKNVWQTLDSYLCMQEILVKNVHSLVLVLKKSGTVSVKTVHKESETKWRKGCCWNSMRADVQFSVLRLHCPEVNSKVKDMVNCRYSMQPTRKRLRLFRIIVSANQLSLLRSSRRDMSNVSLHDRSGRPVVMGQSIVLSAIKTGAFLESDEPSSQIFLLRLFEERIEKLSQQQRLSKYFLWMQDF